MLNEKKLEITASKAAHDQITDLLEALRRQYDLAVNIHGELIEIDRAYFEKQIKPKLAKEPEGKRDRLLLDQGAAAAIHKKAVEAKTNDRRIGNGKSALYLSQRTAFTYQDKGKKVSVGYHGVVLRISVQVSADRRFIRMNLTQSVTELIEINKIQLPAKPGEEPITVETPNLRKTETTVTAEIDDGLWVLLPLSYTRRGDTAKKTVLLALVQPTIYIGEEEREKLRQKMNMGK